MHDRIALGTAQFGLPYGISNREGQTSKSECESILKYAKSVGIHVLDTAIAYGESELTLGAVGVKGWQVITKLPEFSGDVVDVSQWVDQQVTASLERLRLESVHGLLLHRPDQLLSQQGDALYASLVEQQKRGRVEKIGISIYSPQELDEIPRTMRFDIVQAPYNILDRRMISTGWADRLSAQGTEFHARSIFLQGLLLMSGSARPEQFKPWATLWKTWDAWLNDCNLSPVQACLNFALNTPQISRLIIGVNSLTQLREILGSVDRGIQAPPADLTSQDPRLLNPAFWNNI